MAMDNDGGSVGTDSFLDVITNFVGILIILVMVVGDQARHAVLPKVQSPDLTELKAAEAEAAHIEGEVRSIADQMQAVDAELAARTYERDQVQTLLTAVEHDLAARRDALDEADRERYDLERDLALASDDLKKLKEERDLAETTDSLETVTVESYPTPIGKTVNGQEAHFQLLGGRIVFVPFEALIDRLRVTARDYMSRMSASSDLVDTIGPIGGFRMRFALDRYDSPHGSYMQLAHVELLPVSDQLGEPLDRALKPGSDLQDKLSMLSPDRYTITVWTYPDSFAEFRKLKKVLYERGYAVAGRPLPDGMPIGASPSGSKSSAQ